MDRNTRIMTTALGQPDKGSIDPFRPLWRQSGGSLSKAREIARALVGHYKGGEALLADEREFNSVFDWVCAEYFGGGCEIEWAKE